MGQGSEEYYNFYEPEREKRNKWKGFLILSGFVLLMIVFIRVIAYFLMQLQ